MDDWTTLTRDYATILTLFGHYTNDTEGDVDPGFAKLSCVTSLVNGTHKDAKSGDKGGKGEDGDGSKGKGDEDSGAASVYVASSFALASLLVSLMSA